MNNLMLCLMSLLFLFLAGCATLRGMGEDVQNLGKGIKKAVSSNENDRSQRS